MLDNYYWQLPDGTYWHSGRAAVVPADDAQLAAWRADGNFAGSNTLPQVRAVLVRNGLASLAPPAPPPTQAELEAYAAAKRYAVETGGCAWNDHGVATDRDSQSKVLAEFVAIGAGLRADPSGWKCVDGFAAVTNAEMGQVVLAVRTHIAAAFAAEAAVRAAIDAGTITTFAAIDAAAWPENAP